MPCVKSGARAGSLYRNLVAHALTLGASGDRAPVRQQPCIIIVIIIVNRPNATRNVQWNPNNSNSDNSNSPRTRTQITGSCNSTRMLSHQLFLLYNP